VSLASVYRDGEGRQDDGSDRVIQEALGSVGISAYERAAEGSRHSGLQVLPSGARWCMRWVVGGRLSANGTRELFTGDRWDMILNQFLDALYRLNCLTTQSLLNIHLQAGEVRVRCRNGV